MRDTADQLAPFQVSTGPSSAASSSIISGPVQVAGWTPLVTWVMGTSWMGRSGQSSANIRRLVRP